MQNRDGVVAPKIATNGSTNPVSALAPAPAPTPIPTAQPPGPPAPAPTPIPTPTHNATLHSSNSTNPSSIHHHTVVTDFEFDIGEKVLAFHGPVMYEGKILKCENRRRADGVISPHYRVHYNGWKKSHDEWLDSTRVVAFNRQNLEQAEQLKRAAQMQREPKKAPYQRTKTPHSDSEESSVSSKRQKTDIITEPSTPTPLIDLPLSTKLRFQLVEDCQAVTEDKKVVNLPARMSVVGIIKRFADLQKRRNTESPELQPFLRDLRVYFNAVCGTLLLYRQERKQYLDICKKIEPTKATLNPTEPAHIFGAEHLLRLIIKLPDLIVQARLPQEEFAIARQLAIDFVRFLGGKLKEELFCNGYVPANTWKMLE